MEDIKKADEIRRNKLWKSLTPYSKHMALMYMYRLQTDIEHITDYIETFRFINSGISTDDLPNFIHYMKSGQLKEMAYEVIGDRIA